MQSNRARAGVAALLIAIAVALFVVLGGKKDDRDKTATKGGRTGVVPTVVVENGKPVGGIKELDFNKGDEIRFRVRSDVADEIHVHGYDLMKDVMAGGTVSFDFPATIDGIYEAELEGRQEQIIELHVNP